MSELPASGLQLLNLAYNLPGPVTAARLQHMGMRVVKIEPPGGDPLEKISPAWYAALAAGHQVMRLDLHTAAGRQALEPLLASSDLLLTASRPKSLQRAGLSWVALHEQYPQLCHVALVGHPHPDQSRPGHDLTYQAVAGLITPPSLPRLLLADLAGAERAVSAALGLLLARARGLGSGYVEVSLYEAVTDLAASMQYGLTGPGEILGGGLPSYNLYPTRQGWIALAALEPRFWVQLAAALGLETLSHENLAQTFVQRTAAEWQAWALAHDLPLVAVS